MFLFLKMSMRQPEIIGCMQKVLAVKESWFTVVEITAWLTLIAKMWILPCVSYQKRTFQNLYEKLYVSFSFPESNMYKMNNR